MSVSPRLSVAWGIVAVLLSDFKAAEAKFAQVVAVSLPLSLANCLVMVSHAGTIRIRMASKGPISTGDSLAG